MSASAAKTNRTATPPLGDGSGTPSSSPIIHTALLNGRTSPPPLARSLLAGLGWCICEHAEITAEDRAAAFRRFDAAVLVDKAFLRDQLGAGRSPGQDEQLDLLQRFGLGVVVLTARPWAFAGCGAGVVCLPPDAPVDVAYGVLLALSHVRPMLRQIDRQVTNLNRLSETLSQQFNATNRELQLASRLQRDFLPREWPSSGPIRFGTLFRPCTWVSGDIFDIFRLDEWHWGFYIADAVGHGVAAGLLTMYIKHAIRPKRVFPDHFELVPPDEVLSMLNDQLASQALPDSQFITGCYGMIDVQTRGLQYSVAGHPPPLYIPCGGPIRELHGDGSILGLSTNQRFSAEAIRLQPGDRLLLYSDGLEDLLIAHRPPFPEMPTLRPGIPDVLRLPQEEMLAQLRERLDGEPGSLAHADDVTALVMDVGPGGE